MSKFKFQSLICPSERVTAEQLETERNLVAFERSLNLLSRRGFLTRAGLTAAGVAAAAAVAGPGSAQAQTTAPAITDVLNFALNLEFLEANFYLYASQGISLNTYNPSLVGGGPVPTNGGKIALDATTQNVALALAQDEVNHIIQLRTVITSLGGTPIAQPAINLGAKGLVTTQPMFVLAARQFTAVGGSAYIGSAQYLVSNTTVLQAAGQILSAEGYHDGALNFLCANQGVLSPAVDTFDVIPATTPTGTPLFTAAATTALPPSRTTSQVLGIVYGISNSATTTPPAGTTSGGFFPSGFNGNIKST